MRVILISIFLFCITQINGQSIIQPMLCEGPLPEDLNRSISEIIQKNKKDNFRKQNLLGVYEIFSSGKVVFGNSTWKMVDRIGKLILQKNNLDTNVHFYILRSRFCNAFATDEGYIFITTAMLVNAYTEDEIAFVLCHELSHYLLKHNIKNQEHKIKKLSELKKNLKGSKSQSATLKTLDDFLTDYYTFSQKNELQADSLGTILYLNTGYNPSMIIRSLSNLQFKSPLLNHEHFNPEMIEKGFRIMHSNPEISNCKEWLNDKNIKYKSNEIDTSELSEEQKKQLKYKSHPDWDLRVALCQALISKTTHHNTKNTPIPKEVREACLSELILTEYKNGDYMNALSYTLILEKEFPENQSINSLKGICLSYVYLSNSDRETFSSFYFSKDSFVLELDAYITQYGFKQLRSLAIYYNLMCTDKNKLNYLYLTQLKEVSGLMTRHDTISTSFQKYCMFSDTTTIYRPFLHKVEQVVSMFERSDLETDNYARKDKSDFYFHNEEIPKIWNVSSIDSLLLLSPNIVAIPNKKTKRYKKPVLITDRKNYLIHELIRNGKLNNIHYKGISFDDKQNLTTEQYNLYFLIIEIFEESIESAKQPDKIPLSLLYSQSIIEKTGIKKVQMVQLIHNQISVSNALLGFMEIYLIPFSLITAHDFSSEIRMFIKNTTTISIVYNLETNNIEFITLNETGLKPDYSGISSISQMVISATRQHLID